MMNIRIVHRPDGESPDWVRNAWVGLTLPTPYRHARTWRTLDTERSQANLLFRLLYLLLGKTDRVRGFPVTARDAVNVLAETQPAAAEWWRANRPKLLTGRRYLVFDADCCEHLGGTPPPYAFRWGSRRFNDAYPASPGRIAALWFITTIVRIGQAMTLPSEQMYSVASVVGVGTAPILAALVAAWVLRLRSSTIHLVAALVTIDLYLTIFALAVRVVTQDADLTYWFIALLYLLILTQLIGRSFAGLRTGKRRIAAILLAAGIYLGTGHVQVADATFWRLSSVVRPLIGQADPSDDSDEPPPQIDADVLWGAQPVLIQKQTAALRSRTTAKPNVYAVAVAGSGTQALFSREAHEALRTVAAHFGDESRGGVLLSNDRDDFMQVPLATRDNIAAVAKDIGDRADHRKDLLFIYLASHGSRMAELSSELPDYQSVQPISSASIARALRDSGVARRIVVISACYSASWIQALADDNTIVIAAAAKDRTSFGCDDSRRLTVFGESFLGNLAVKGISLHDAFEDAKGKIAVEEARDNVTPSLPQAFVGRNMHALWLDRAP